MPGTGECASSPIGSESSSRLGLKLALVGHELPRDRVVRIGTVDQVGKRRGSATA